ncbi:MAG: patatin-like phospholipase family protein, partial [Beijerinckiaceae bacterium]
IALGIAGVLAQRLARVQQPARETGKPRVFALRVAGHFPAARLRAIAGRLKTHAAEKARICLVTEPWADNHREKLHAIEQDHDFVFLIADDASDDWRDYCCRQADVQMVFARVNDEPYVLERQEHQPRIELVLEGDGTAPAGRAAQWAAATGARDVHHIIDDSDIARLARLMTRTALSIVLSGGGARSFAHLGVLEALREAGIVADILGGTSMGAVIAAAYAAGFSPDAVKRDIRKVFVEQRPMSDPTFPVVSFFRGRKIARLLEAAFGGRFIEDLRQPFFCLSSDIGNAEPVIHRTGLLRRWLQASVTIPGVFPPVLDGGRVLVDGGVIDNMPVDAAVSLQRGRVIGIDVSGDDGQFAPPPDRIIPWWQRISGARRPGEPDIVETLWRVGTIGSVSSLRRGLRTAHLVIKPPVARVPLLDWKRFDATVALGYDHTKSIIAAQPEVFGPLRNAVR